MFVSGFQFIVQQLWLVISHHSICTIITLPCNNIFILYIKWMMCTVRVKSCITWNHLHCSEVFILNSGSLRCWGSFNHQGLHDNEQMKGVKTEEKTQNSRSECRRLHDFRTKLYLPMSTEPTWAAPVVFINCFTRGRSSPSCPGSCCICEFFYQQVLSAVVIFQAFVQCLQVPLPCSLDPWHSCRWSRSAPRHISVSEACSCTTLYIACPLWMNSTPLSINSSASDCMGVCGPPGKTSRVVRDLKDASLRCVSVNHSDPANCFTLGLTCRKKFW